MRLSDISDYFRLRSLTTNPMEILRFRKRQQNGEVLVVHLRQGERLFLRGGFADFHMFHRIFLRDEYRLAGLNEKHLGCVLDLGANVGMFSCRLADVADRVIAYEPIPVNFRQLSLNTKTRRRVDAVPAAVGARRGVLTFHEPSRSGRSGSYSHLVQEDVDPQAEIQVESISLDEVFERHDVEACDLLKLDVEGSEYDIMHAASDDTWSRIRRIHGEYHRVPSGGEHTRIENFTAFLEAHGFEVEVCPHSRKSNHGIFFARRQN